MKKQLSNGRTRVWLNRREMAACLGISVQAFLAWKVEPVARIGREAFFTADDVVANRLGHARRAQ